jgi:hypothetical protein
MALTPINEVAVKKGGKGGLFGKIAGTVVGGVAGALTGNPALAVSGASLGGSLGGTIGEVADPTKVSQNEQVPLSRMANDPKVQMAQLVDAQKALMSSNRFTLPEKEELNQSVFSPTLQKLKQMGT